MKPILAVSVLALVGQLAFAGVASASIPGTSLATFEKGNPDDTQSIGFVGPITFHRSPGPAVTSLHMFDRGDPDETVTAGYDGYVGPNRFHGPMGPAVSSLAKFERGDHEVSPGT